MLFNWGSTLLAAIFSASLTAAFENPVREPAPDPSLVFADGTYHLTFTSYNRITIVRSNTLSGLPNGEQKTIWTDTNTTPATQASRAATAAPRVFCEDATPLAPTIANQHLADLIPPEGSRGGLDDNFAFSIDGTFLEVPGFGRYHVLSIRDNEFNQALAITQLDTDSWTVGAWHVISIPDQPWERNITGANPPPCDDLVGVNEALHPLYHGDDIWLCYSASNCATPNYSLGLLHWNGGDPLLKSSWDKTGPVFSQANGLYGTGHNSFFTSPDGTEIWNAFHATRNSAGSCGGDRFTSAQIVTFDENNNPNFGVPQPLGEILTPPSG
ncbi:glycosyl hydrolase family 43 protein [Colletotrichum kahawae]|uniref:Glycosyl hydrolase family 43 protein n=1 Tax=Colletotrichum kahawae TaxID=34407 RepID=A0AAE0CZU9_COLKA|nr:glycosyl hydrolase family 43 protein [Colletotrichum kahawae]